MNREQMLLLKLSEECNEIGQMCSKSIRFGLENKHPDGGLTNRERLHQELNDLGAVISLLINAGVIHDEKLDLSTEQLEEREAKIEKYLLVSKNLSILQ